jgi:hypothetical protein
MTSLFGGDPSMSHFTVGVRYIMPNERHGTGDPEARRMAPQRRREQNKVLRDLGFKTPYFQYRNKDEAGKAAAKKKAEAFCAEWSAKVDFELEIAEGCFF